MKLYQNSNKTKYFFIFMIALFVSIFVLFYVATDNVSDNLKDNKVDTLLKALDAAVINSYAIYGRYPENLEEIKDKYGVIIDDDMFIVQYDIISTSIRPNVAVLIKEDTDE